MKLGIIYLIDLWINTDRCLWSMNEWRNIEWIDMVDIYITFLTLIKQYVDIVNHIPLENQKVWNWK